VNGEAEADVDVATICSLVGGWRIRYREGKRNLKLNVTTPAEGLQESPSPTRCRFLGYSKMPTLAHNALRVVRYQYIAKCQSHIVTSSYSHSHRVAR